MILNLDPEGDTGQAADFQWEIGRHSDRLRSLLGFLDLPPRHQLNMPLDPVQTLAWWTSFQPLLLAGIASGTMIFLGISWVSLMLVYAPGARFIAFYFDRHCDASGALKLTAAALLPGALFLTGAIALYGLRWIPLIALLIAFALHFPIGWIYVAFAPLHLPKLNSNSKGNPFSPA